MPAPLSLLDTNILLHLVRGKATGATIDTTYISATSTRACGTRRSRSLRAPVSRTWSPKGMSDIGDQINKKIIGPLARENKPSDMPDFNNATKLGGGREVVDRLTNLIANFENPALDFSRNRAEGTTSSASAPSKFMGATSRFAPPRG